MVEKANALNAEGAKVSAKVAKEGKRMRPTGVRLASVYCGRRVDYGPTLAASGVVTGVTRPMNSETVLSPELAVQTSPDGSAAIPMAAFNEP